MGSLVHSPKHFKIYIYSSQTWREENLKLILQLKKKKTLTLTHQRHKSTLVNYTEFLDLGLGRGLNG